MLKVLQLLSNMQSLLMSCAANPCLILNTLADSGIKPVLYSFGET